MRAFKNLDYFRKIAPEHTKPTVLGGLISILSLTVRIQMFTVFQTILTLFYYELTDFVKPKISKDTFIASDPNEEKFVSMNLDISFYSVPCFSKSYFIKTKIVIDIEVKNSLTELDK